MYDDIAKQLFIYNTKYEINNEKTDIGISLLEHASIINEFYCDRCSTNKK